MSIPFVGVGVGVAVTGYELKDGCDNLKDLRALELALNPTLDESDEQRRVCGTVPPTREEVIAKVRSAPGEVWEGAKQYVPELPEVDFGGAWASGLGMAGDAVGWAGETASGAGRSVSDAVVGGWNWVWGE